MENIAFTDFIKDPDADKFHEIFGIDPARVDEIADLCSCCMDEIQDIERKNKEAFSRAEVLLYIEREGYKPQSLSELAYVLSVITEFEIKRRTRMKLIGKYGNTPAIMLTPIIEDCLDFNSDGPCNCENCRRKRGEID